MRDRFHREDRIERYLRDAMSPEDEAAFETALLESPELQGDLEAALALRAVLARGSNEAEKKEAQAATPAAFERTAGWRPLALAASAVLAIVSTVMWWKTGNEAAGLERQLQVFTAPRGEVLTVPVPIMRSAGTQTPDVIVQKPAGRAAIVLDIELGLAAREQASLDFALMDTGGSVILFWKSSPAPDGRASAVLPSEQVPATRLRLQISATDGRVLDQRLLEFRE